MGVSKPVCKAYGVAAGLQASNDVHRNAISKLLQVALAGAGNASNREQKQVHFAIPGHKGQVRAYIETDQQ